MDLKWYAVYTKPRWEKKIAESLTKKGFENYCPLNRQSKQWHDRKKIVHEPLFTSYVFVRTEEIRLSRIRAVDGIINLVYWLKKPAVIRTEEIDTIRKFLNEYGYAELEKVAVSVDDRVRILNGAFMNEEGSVVSVSNKSVKVALPSLGYLMVAHTGIQNIKVIVSNVSEEHATA